VGRIELPPLRERKGDVPMLVEHFVKQLGGDFASIDRAALARFGAYSWPGNVRELRNAVARYLALRDLEAVPEGSTHVPSSDDDRSQDIERPFASILEQNFGWVEARRRAIDEFELRYTARLLAQHGGNVTKAAAASGIALRSFQRLRARTLK
jgi:DNA-binding NtrC family response regulator